eukprot:6447-Heterococcus_DN1.PRE.1
MHATASNYDTARARLPVCTATTCTQSTLLQHSAECLKALFTQAFCNNAIQKLSSSFITNALQNVLQEGAFSSYLHVKTVPGLSRPFTIAPASSALRYSAVL